MRIARFVWVLIIGLISLTCNAWSTSLVSGQDLGGGVEPSPYGSNAVSLSSGELMRLVHKRIPVTASRMLDGGKLHGIVTAEICVDQHGKVVRIKILRGHPIAYQPVLESVRSWRFAPYKVNGHAVPVVTELEVPFDFRTLPRANQSSKVD